MSRVGNAIKGGNVSTGPNLNSHLPLVPGLEVLVPSQGLHAQRVRHLDDLSGLDVAHFACPELALRVDLDPNLWQTCRGLKYRSNGQQLILLTGS